jgi:hypothetical protein
VPQLALFGSVGRTIDDHWLLLPEAKATRKSQRTLHVHRSSKYAPLTRIEMKTLLHEEMKRENRLLAAQWFSQALYIPLPIMVQEFDGVIHRNKRPRNRRRCTKRPAYYNGVLIDPELDLETAPPSFSGSSGFATSVDSRDTCSTWKPNLVFRAEITNGEYP